MCFDATMTPPLGTAPRTSKSSPAHNLSPRIVKRHHCRAIHTVARRGNTTTGKNTIDITVVRSANHNMKSTERKIVIAIALRYEAAFPDRRSGALLNDVVATAARYFRYSAWSVRSVPGFFHHSSRLTRAGSTG